MIKLFIGGFSPVTQELEIVQLLSNYGQVSTIQIVRDKLSKKSKGYAFVEITTRAGADAIIETLDATEFQGKELSIRFATAKTEGPAHLRFQKRPRRTDL